MDYRSYGSFLPHPRQGAVTDPATSQSWAWKGHTIHVARRVNAHAPVQMIVCHGAGGYSDALWPICAQIPVHLCDLHIPDLPLYWHTSTSEPRMVRYEDWIACLHDYIQNIDDGRPVVLWGFSIGGLLAHEVASRLPFVNEVVATCLVDPRSLRARLHIGRWGLGVMGAPFLGLGRRSPFAELMIPMRYVANMGRMSRNSDLSILCMRDPRGGGTRIPLGFLASFLTYRHAFTTSQGREPVHTTLVHPAKDAWTPPSLSVKTLDRMDGSKRIVMLENCGHFPVEEPGLTQLIAVVTQLLEDATRTPEKSRSKRLIKGNE